MTPLQILEKVFLTDRLCYEPGLEGQRVDDDGIIYVGDRAGPSHNFSNLVHELCHFVEIDDARQQSRNWGLKVPTVTVFGRICAEPVTRQPTERELRVMAYQANFLEEFSIPVQEYDLVRALTGMPDFIHVPLEDGRPAYGDGAPSRDEVPYAEIDDSRIRWMIRRVQGLRQEYTFERFCSEWFRKIALLG